MWFQNSRSVFLADGAGGCFCGLKCVFQWIMKFLPGPGWDMLILARKMWFLSQLWDKDGELRAVDSGSVKEEGYSSCQTWNHLVKVRQHCTFSVVNLWLINRSKATYLQLGDTRYISFISISCVVCSFCIFVTWPTPSFTLSEVSHMLKSHNYLVLIRKC